MQKVNVERIMEDLRGEIAKRPYKDKIISFKDMGEFLGNAASAGNFVFSELVRQIDAVNAKYSVLEYRFFPMNGVANKIKAIIKKIIRKPLRFYIHPIVTDQNEFNASVTRSLNQVKAYIEENQNLKKEVTDLKEKVRVLTKQLNDYQLESAKGEDK